MMNWSAIEEIDYFDDDELEVPPEPLGVESDEEDGNYMEPLSCYTSVDGTTWVSEERPPKTGRAKRANVVRECVGTTKEYNRATNGSIVDSFRFFFTDEMLEVLVRETNREAERASNEHQMSNFVMERWAPTNTTEMLAFLGSLLLIGSTRGRLCDLEELFSPQVGLPALRATFTKLRFKLLLRFLRFDNKGARVAKKTRDKLAPVRDLWETFLRRCKAGWKLSENVCVDERLVPFRGRCPFLVYMPSKPDRYGIKVRNNS